MLKFKYLFLLVVVGMLLMGPQAFGATGISVVKVFDAPQGSQPSGLAWYGGYLWMSSYKLKPGIYKIDPKSGVLVAFFAPAIVWDGRYGGLEADQFSLFHIQANNGNNYVRFSGADLSDLKKMRLKSNVMNFSDPAILENKLWAIGNNEALNPNDYRLYKFSYEGELVGSYRWPQELFNVQNFGMTSDGYSLWVSAGQKLLKVDQNSGRIIMSFDLPFDRVESLAWDGEAIWAASFNGGIYRIAFGEVAERQIKK